MYIFAEPVPEAEVDQIQSTNKAKIEAWEQQVLGRDQQGEDARSGWRTAQNGIAQIDTPEGNTEQNTLEAADGSPGIPSINNPSAEGQECNSAGSDAAGSITTPSTSEEVLTSYPRDLLAMVLTTKSIVNGSRATTVTNLSDKDQWKVQYELGIFDKEKRAATLYNHCKTRRRKIMQQLEAEREDAGEGGKKEDYFFRILRDVTAKSGRWRTEKENLDKKTITQMWNGKTAARAGVDSTSMASKVARGGVDDYMTWLYASESSMVEKHV